MDWVFLVGRLMFAAIFFNSGLFGDVLGHTGMVAHALSPGGLYQS